MTTMLHRNNIFTDSLQVLVPRRQEADWDAFGEVLAELIAIFRWSALVRYASTHHDDVKSYDRMRTTIDIPDDLHAQAVAIARDTHQSLSQAVAGLIRRGLSSGDPGEVAINPRTGLAVAHLGRTITSEDVRRLEDDDQ